MVPMMCLCVGTLTALNKQPQLSFSHQLQKGIFLSSGMYSPYLPNISLLYVFYFYQM